MRSLNIADYMVQFKVPDRLEPGRMIEGEHPFHVKDSILNLLFSKDLQMTGAETIKQNILAMKLEACSEDVILLEDEEFARIVKAFAVHTGFGRNEVELLKRIQDAETVEAETVKLREV